MTRAFILGLMYVWHEHAALFRGAARVIREQRFAPSKGSMVHRLVVLAERLHAEPTPEPLREPLRPFPAPLLKPRH